MRWPVLRQCLAAGLCLCAGALAAPVQAQDTPGTAHPQRWPRAHSRGLVDAAAEARIERLLHSMRLEEKVGQMIQADTSSITPEDLREFPLGSILAGGNSPSLGTTALRSPAADWVASARAFRQVAQEQRPGHVPIPLLFGIDAVHGNSHVLGATVFPHNVGLGAAHDTDLLRRIGAATAQETAAAGFDWAFGPTLAVPQDVRWGRSYEGYSDDPALVARYAGPFVRGLQGDPGAPGPLQAGHVAASAKHFLADGGTRDGVDQGDAQIPESDLIDIHGRAYRDAVEAGVMTVMASFSSWQGVKMTGNHSLLTGVLKQRMGFEGFVVSDWNSHAQLPGCTEVNCPAAVLAGVDMLMAPGSWRGLYASLLAQARSGQIPSARIDDAVRRILRVKMRLGLFDAARPWEGRTGVLASPAHRSLAREAVRKSLVLLKNAHGVLPIRASARVLLAGSGADSIAMQCGGWTLSWQGNGNHNADFPAGESIAQGLRAALMTGGGSLHVAAQGADDVAAADYDVAVVAFGESPYAEGWGDLKNLQFSPGDARDLLLLRQYHARGLPVVAVFLSGRPLWVNPYLNASDAFVAAWLPGSEGGGIADVLVGDTRGSPRHDFSGRLGYSWPASASPQAARHELAPLFARGYGLDYRHPATPAVLDEQPGVNPADSNFSQYLIHGRAQPPWSLQLLSGLAGGAGGTPAAAGAELLAQRLVDADGLQEGGRELAWSGAGPATAVLTGPPLDMRMLSNGEAAVSISLRVDAAPAGPALLGLGCGPGCAGAVDLGTALRAAAPGQWLTLKVKLSCLREAGADVSHIDEAFTLGTAGAMRLTLTNVQLNPDPAGAICPPHP